MSLPALSHVLAATAGDAGGGLPAYLVVPSIALIVTGLFFFLGASVGLVRFPDFYTRMHAAGKGDTLSTVLITFGMALLVFGDLHHWYDALVAVKIVAIGVFIMLTSPTSTHSLMKAGFDDGIKPVTSSRANEIHELADTAPGGGAAGPPEPAPPASALAEAAAGSTTGSGTAADPPQKKAARKKTARKKAARKKSAKKKTTATKRASKRPARKRPKPESDPGDAS